MAKKKKNISGGKGFLAIFSCIILCYCLPSGCSQAAKDTLRAGEVLNSDAGDFLVSKNKRFQFSLFNTNAYSNLFSVPAPSSGPFLAVISCVYKNNSKILWSPDFGADEDSEDAKQSAYIRMNQTGELVFSRWKTNVSFVINSDQTAMVKYTEAKLLDNGNLILVAQGNVLWQSFDHPTNTWFQGMKLGILGLDTRKMSRSLVASYFRFGIDPDNPNQLISTNFSQVYWHSGTWNEQNSFLEFLAKTSLDISFMNTFDANGINYFTFSSKNDPFAFLMLDKEGKIHISSGNLSVEYEVIIDCETEAEKERKYQSKGCIFCEAGDEFEEINGTLDVWDNYTRYYGNHDFLNCEELCRNNCSCTAYAYTTTFDAYYIQRYNCKFSGSRRYGGSMKGKTFFFRKRLALDKGAHGSPMKKVGISVGAAAAVLVVLALLCIFFCYLQRRKLSFQAISRLKGVHEDDYSVSFSFASIEIATDQFSDENKLGEGGYGPVYKGVLYNGQEIAVKRLHKITRHGEEQFKNEVSVISKLQHRNLVRLLGYCIHKEERILVYEYLPNNSLDSILFGTKKQTILDWKLRAHIIEGVAQGLLYLHKYSRSKIIHRDLKTSNILLDTNLNPKISDFGTAKIFGDELFSASTKRIAGTLSYMSPEYAVNGVFSTRSDVFSFGVIVLEIISGKKNSSFHDSDQYINLLAYVWHFWINGRATEIKDPNLVETIADQEVIRYIQVGLLCVQEKAADRPTMVAAVSMITNGSMVLPAPKKPGFSAVMGLKNESVCEMPEVFSVNRVTISDIEGR